MSLDDEYGTQDLDPYALSAAHLTIQRLEAELHKAEKERDASRAEVRKVAGELLTKMRDLEAAHEDRADVERAIGASIIAAEMYKRQRDQAQDALDKLTKGTGT